MYQLRRKRVWCYTSSNGSCFEEQYVILSFPIRLLLPLLSLSPSNTSSSNLRPWKERYHLFQTSSQITSSIEPQHTHQCFLWYIRLVSNPILPIVWYNLKTLRHIRKHVLADPTSFEEPLLDTSLSVVVGEQGDLISVSQLGSTLVSQSEAGISRDILPECITNAKLRREILSKQIFKWILLQSYYFELFLYKKKKERVAHSHLALASHSTWSNPTFVFYILSFPSARNIPVNHVHHLARISIIRQPLPVIHTQDFHPFMIHQIRQ